MAESQEMSQDLEPDDATRSQTEDCTGRFVRSEKKLGSGSTKVVYQARDEEEGVDVAWNEVAVHATQPTVQRFMNEITILEGLEHTNILKCATHFMDREKMIFITEMMPGGTLKKFIAQSKNHRLKLRVTQKICRQLLRALDYLHSREPPVIHSDLKCENIFIDAHNCEVKLGDFGLSGTLGSISSSGHRLEFMAPETMVEDGTYTCKGDVYSFGMCVLEMVTGLYPYTECKDEDEIRQKVAAKMMPTALDSIVVDEYRIVADGVQTNVKDFILECLAPDDKRPSSHDLLRHPFIVTPIPPEQSSAHPSLTSAAHIAACSASSNGSSVFAISCNSLCELVPQSPESPLANSLVYQSDSASALSHLDPMVAAAAPISSPVEEHGPASDEEGARPLRRHNSWPVAQAHRSFHLDSFLHLDASATGRRHSFHPVSPDHLEISLDDAIMLTPKSGQSSSVRSMVHATGSPISSQLTKDNLKQWGTISHTDSFVANHLDNHLDCCDGHYTSDPDSGAEDQPPSLKGAEPLLTTIMVMATAATPSEGSSAMNSEPEHTLEAHSPNGSVEPMACHLDQLCCESGNGAAIQKLLDEEKEVLERMRQVEREYADRAARRLERLRKWESELNKYGMGIPVSKPPLLGKGLGPQHRDPSLVSTSPMTAEMEAARKVSGSDLDGWDIASPPPASVVCATHLLRPLS